MVKINLTKVLLVILFIWALIATSLTVNYYKELEIFRRSYEDLARSIDEISTEVDKCQKLYLNLKSKVISINIGIDYGNGTIHWYNNTVIPRGTNVLSALILVSKVEYTYAQYGAYITSINGIKEKIISKKEGYSWMWYLYNPETGKLEYGPVAADQYILSNNQTILWKYEHWKYLNP